MAELLTDDPERAADCLAAGGLAVLPTETVYGLGADAEQPAAVGRIFTVKGRPAGHPLIVHLPAADALDDWARAVPAFARDLAATCWPGPLTLLLARSGRVSDAITGGRDSVGLRVPAHPLTATVLRLLSERTGRSAGVAAPSANRFGSVSPTTAAHVVADLGRRLDADRDVVLDGGPSGVGVESTIVDCTADPPQLLRPGAITAAEVEAILGGPLAAAAGPSRAAGMLRAHYAPRARVHLADSEATAAATAAALAAGGARPAVIGDGDLATYARSLYAWLRAADDRGDTDVVAVLPPASGLGFAIRDRLTKAAAAHAADEV